ncbi:hypothetical protein IT397_00090 [Candidatus Nomurabacteria bacterium]|nr:hypothetical protein [Candidatus Nomurabacteria bacterium]
MYEGETNRRLLELVEENNRILRKMQRKSRWGTVYSILKWTLIIVITFWSYITIQPYINVMINTYNQLQTTSANLSKINSKIPAINTNSTDPVSNLLKSFGF